MLIENKFIYVSLPRCASTSFHIACLRNKLDIKYYDDSIHADSPKEISADIDGEYVADRLIHSHERLIGLKNKFGGDFPIISVRRDPYERYISLWKHIIDELYKINEIEIVERFKTLEVDDILSYKAEDIVSDKTKYLAIDEWLERNKISEPRSQLMDPYKRPYIKAMLLMLLSPLSYYHHHDRSIIWFDIKELDTLEKWVSEILGVEFKMEKTNSSQNFYCSLVNDENFRKKYDSIYKKYDHHKIMGSII